MARLSGGKSCLSFVNVGGLRSVVMVFVVIECGRGIEVCFVVVVVGVCLCLPFRVVMDNMDVAVGWNAVLC